MTGWTMRFPGAAVTTEWRGSNGDDSRAAGVVPRCGGDDDDGGGGRGDGGVVPMVEEEQDDTVLGRGCEGQADVAVPRHGNGMEAVRVAAAWTRRRRRRREKFWQPDDVQVKILRLGFKDRVTGVL
jgi:hypothetical protein